MKHLFTVYFILFSFAAFAQDGSKTEAAFPFLKKYHNVRDLTISTDNQEAYITVQSTLSEISVIIKLKQSKGEWSEDGIVNFSGVYNDLEPFLSPDNLRLYFVSNRPLDTKSKETKDYDIWYVERKDVNSDWEKPVNLGAPVNTVGNEFYPSLSKSKNLYFTSDQNGTKGKDDIFFCEWKNNKYENPISLNDSINTKGYEFNAFIASDESYLIFTGYNWEGGKGSGDLYISFKDSINVWSKAQTIKEVNSPAMDYCPYYESKTNTLYFTSKRSSFEKVNEFKTTDYLLHELNKDENGESKIFKTNFNPFKYK